MKRCPNPACEAAFLFGDSQTLCPFCHSRLMETGDGAQVREALPPDRITIAEENGGGPVFRRERRSGLECHGRIVEIDRQELFNSRWHKLANSLFRGEPYQFAHQTIEYTIRVENITDGYATEVTDFCLYGSYLGRMQVGDEVIIRARERNGRRIAQDIYNETTETAVHPGFQMPAALVRGTFLALAAFAVWFMCGVVWLFRSGAVAAAVSALVASVMPLVILCFGLWLMIGSVFPRRRR